MRMWWKTAQIYLKKHLTGVSYPSGWKNKGVCMPFFTAHQWMARLTYFYFDLRRHYAFVNMCACTVSIQKYVILLPRWLTLQSWIIGCISWYFWQLIGYWAYLFGYKYCLHLFGSYQGGWCIVGSVKEIPDGNSYLTCQEIRNKDVKQSLMRSS